MGDHLGPSFKIPYGDYICPSGLDIVQWTCAILKTSTVDGEVYKDEAFF